MTRPAIEPERAIGQFDSLATFNVRKFPSPGPGPAGQTLLAQLLVQERVHTLLLLGREGHASEARRAAAAQRVQQRRRHRLLQVAVRLGLHVTRLAQPPLHLFKLELRGANCNFCFLIGSSDVVHMMNDVRHISRRTTPVQFDTRGISNCFFTNTTS